MLLPENFEAVLSDVIEITKSVEGYLTEREIKFLFLLGVCPTANGEVLEIGSFKGKSTIVLAKAVKCINNKKVISVDPLTSPAITDPALKDKSSVLEDFQNNIKFAKVEDSLEFHQMFSYELAKDWNRMIRLLWVDGDHTYLGTKVDFDLFSKFLSDGAIVAFHDVLANFDGPIRVFMNDILLSDSFGPAGLCGTIGWAQYLQDNKQCLKYKEEKLKLYLKLSRLIPIVSLSKPLCGLRKLKYKLFRYKVPHSELTPKKWVSKIIFRKENVGADAY